MFDFSLLFQDGRKECLSTTLPCLVGRGEKSQIRIRSLRVSTSHARFYQLAEGVYVEDFGSITGTYLNQMRISRAGPLQATDEIVIGTCKLKVCRSKTDVDRKHLESFNNRQLKAMTLDLEQSDSYAQSVVQLDHGCEGDISSRTLFNHDVPIDSHASRSLSESTSTDDLILSAHHCQSPLIETHQELFENLRLALFRSLDVRKQDITGMSTKDLRQLSSELLDGIISVDFKDVESSTLKLLMSALLDEAFGFGLIEPLLSDPGVSEIMINRYDKVFVERHGSIHPHPLRFSSEAALRTVMDRMLQRSGKRIDEGSPMADARLGDGSRLNAVIPPIALHGACMTVRKFPQSRLSLDQMVEQQCINQEVCDFLKHSVIKKQSMLISGGTGTGKTTLLNALMSAIPRSERLITIEDAAELSLPLTTNHVSLETRAKNTEGKGEVTIRELVRNALRMRPDRIVVGECRGAEALDMLTAMNTGHEGSMATLHANSPRDAISRLETLVLMAQNGLPSAAIRGQITSAIDLIIQLKRLSSGKRVISNVSSITGIESGVIQLQMIYEMKSDQCR